MRLCSYVVKHDVGLAPNPLWEYWTLAVSPQLITKHNIKLSGGDRDGCSVTRCNFSY